MPYRSNPRLADLLTRQGDIAAQREMDQGRIWGGAVQNIGQQVASTLGQIAQQKQDAPRRAMQDEMGRLQLDEARRGAAGAQRADQEAEALKHAKTKDEIFAVVGPERGAKIVQGLSALADQENKTFTSLNHRLGALGVGVKALPAPMQAESWQSTIDEGIRQGWLTPETAPKSPDEAIQRAISPDKYFESQQPKLQSVAPGGTMIDANHPDKGAVFTAPPDPDKAADNARAEAIAQEAARHNRAMEARPVGGMTAAAGNDVKESIAGMKDGTIPPIMPGRASKDYTALMAEAHRQGYDLAGAATDWAATQKHIATMNGAQQLRLNQAINSLPEMLESVDALASKWKGGRFPILNRANLKLAKGGAYGPEVASIANQLDAQIADVTADLGNVYMGGNSPTDHALGLAGKSLNGDWDEKVLHDMVKLAKNNVTIRRNSILNTGVAGASANNPYGNQAQPATAPPAIGGGGAPTYQDYLKSRGQK